MSSKVYRQDFGGLAEYLIIGKTLKDVVRTYAELVGFPLLVPRWAFGYLAGGMKCRQGTNSKAWPRHSSHDFFKACLTNLVLLTLSWVSRTSS